MPMPGDSGGLLLREGETHVIFAKLASGAESPHWFGETSACMLPEDSTPSDKELAKRLDHWLKSQED
jgi:hypothetical protein